MNFWDKVKKDVQKGIREGMDIVREGAAVAKVKAGELTDEGKRRYHVLALKTRVQKELSELGGNIYDLRKKIKNPLSNSKVKDVITKIEKLEAQITKLEGKKTTPAKKKKPQAAKKTTKTAKKATQAARKPKTGASKTRKTTTKKA